GAHNTSVLPRERYATVPPARSSRHAPPDPVVGRPTLPRSAPSRGARSWSPPSALSGALPAKRGGGARRPPASGGQGSGPGRPRSGAAHAHAHPRRGRPEVAGDPEPPPALVAPVRRPRW